MLVLSRKLQQRICIGDNIVVTVLRLQGNSVRLGIEAPRDVHVVRSELPQFDGPPLQADDEEGESEPTDAPLPKAELTPAGATLAARVEHQLRCLTAQRR